MARVRKNTPLLNKEYYMKYWQERLTEIALNIFEWEGLPEEINKDAMEKSIMLGGYAIFFKDSALNKYFALTGALSGVDVYGYPSMARPISMNGVINFNELNMDECVIIYANKLRTSALQFIVEYADKLSELDLAIKLNTMAMKHPVVIKGTEETKMSFETVMHQYEQSYYQIVTDKSMSIDGDIQVLNLNVDSMEILNLQKEKETVLNEFFNLFGVSGSVEKRERIFSGEINSMMEQVSVSGNIWLGTRLSAIDKINKMFGLNVSCKFVTESDEEIEQPLEKEEEEEINE